MKKRIKNLLISVVHYLSKDELNNATIMDSKGRFFKPFNPECKDFDIEVIALALSRTKRFFGQTQLSVAQHSVNMANYFLDRGQLDFAKQALLHEVGEAYMGDLVSPLKKAIPLFKEIEEQIIKKVFLCNGLAYPIADEVHVLDKRIVIDEAIALMPNAEYWRGLGEPLMIKIEVLSEEEAFESFMALARKLNLN